MQRLWKMFLTACKLSVMAAPVVIAPYINEANATGGGGSGSCSGDQCPCEACVSQEQTDLTNGMFNMANCNATYEIAGFGMFGYNGAHGRPAGCSWGGTGMGSGLTANASAIDNFLVTYICPAGYNCVTDFGIYYVGQCTPVGSQGDYIGGVSMTFWCGNT